MMRVKLSAPEMALAAQLGCMRTINAITRQSRAAHGLTNQDVSWQLAIEGAMGEWAVAKALGVMPAMTTLPTYTGDLAQRLEVRTTPRAQGRLILHASDPSDRPYFLAIGRDGTYTIAGWAWGYEGKRTEYWDDPGTGRPAFFVPQHQLHPLADIRRTPDGTLEFQQLETERVGVPA